jgi:bifunctional DNA-binding transcriptional regulator/antitoxin component of YhaV-PrlF toxin-antitoxin module
MKNLSSKGQITIPQRLLSYRGIKRGNKVQREVTAKGALAITRDENTTPLAKNR